MKSEGNNRWYLGRTFPRIPKGKRSDLDFKKRFDRSIRKLQRVPPLQLSIEKRRNFATRFNNVISFDQWLSEKAKTAAQALHELYRLHGVPPESVLGDLVWATLREETMFSDETRRELTKKLRSLNSRKKDAHLLKEAAKIARWWRLFLDVNVGSSGYLPVNKNLKLTWECCTHLETLANRLLEIEPQRYRPKDQFLHFVASILDARFKQVTGEGLEPYNYELLHAFFPEKQGQVSDPRKAAKNLLRKVPAK